MIDQYIYALVRYGLEKNLITEFDKDFAVNRILEILQLDSYDNSYEAEIDKKYQEGKEDSLVTILDHLLDFAYEKKLIEENTVTYRDLFDTKLMAALMPRPSEVLAEFQKNYKESPEKATDYFYKLSQDSNYIRRDRVKRDLKWKYPSKYGELDITINLSKPEKDPKAIAAAKNAPQSSYPKCLLCKENVGYVGRLNHPARGNHRIIPIFLEDGEWGLQYSPYVYYNEHCICFCTEHVPMKIHRQTFQRLLRFVEKFPHYFIGSNADLPIVGGSILSHDHFQGGRYEFAMAKAEILDPIVFKGFESVQAGIVKWPMSVIRISDKNPETLVDLADKILKSWRAYTDEEAFVYAETEGEPHNTITPIARFRDGRYELDLVLRNNITTKEHPLGVYHPHEKLHHIKKENIGLIEVMGLAVLPARLKHEMELLAQKYIAGEKLEEEESLKKHCEWFENVRKTHAELDRKVLLSDMKEGQAQDKVMQVLQTEIGKVFEEVLEDSGVFKCNEEGLRFFHRFVDCVNR